MKNFLVFLAMLIIAIPLLVIVQNITGWHLASEKGYFFLVGAFVVLVVLYRQQNKAGKGQS